MNRLDADPIAGGIDPLDARLTGTPPDPALTGGWWLRRPALGLAVTRLPTAALLCAGILAGPYATALLPGDILQPTAPAIAICLAALGGLVGLHVNVRSRRHAADLARGAAEAGAAAAAIAGVVATAIALALVPLQLPALFIGLLALCCASSAVGELDERGGWPVGRAPRGYFGDLAPIACGGVLLAWLNEPSSPAALWLSVNVVGVTLAIAAGGAVFIAQTSAESEQRVYLAGVLLLLAGAAVHLGASPLLAGFLAGVVWNGWGGVARDRIAHDVGYVQHPLLVVLLVGAGATVQLSADVFVGSPGTELEFAL